MLAQKFQTPPQHQCKDSRVPALERRIAELERLLSASSQAGTNVNTVDIEQEEKPARGLNLKTQTWYGNKINFDVAAKPIEYREGVWYQVTGADAKGPYFFTQCPPDCGLPTKSVVIPKGYHHENWVQLLCDAGIITGEKIEFCPDSTAASHDTCYPLTNQAIEYANQKQINESCERKGRKKKRKAKHRKNNKHLAKKTASEFKSLTSISDDSRFSSLEKRLTELENLVSVLSSRDKAEDLQESSTSIYDTVDNAKIEQEEKYPGLKLKKPEWKGREINLEIEAKRPYSNENAWYDVVGYYTYIDGQVDFTQYPYDLFRIRGSVAAIEIGEDHDKIVHFLYNAGIITKEVIYTSIGVSMKCKCYRMTDQAIKYAHRKRR